MKIVLCVKAVFDSNDTNNRELTLNPYDLATLQYFIEMKENYDLELTCLCMGPESVESVLRYCLAMGADKAVMISDVAFAGSDTYATSLIIAETLKRIEYDIIVCGAKSIDGETGQVPFGIANRLNLICLSKVIKIEKMCGRDILVNRYMDNYLETVSVQTPVLLSFKDFSITDSTVSLLRLKRSKKENIQVYNRKNLQLDNKQCGLQGSLTKVVEINKEVIQKEKKIIEGTTKEFAVFLKDEILSTSKGEVDK